LKIERSEALWLIASILLSSTPVAFMTFEFMLPNVSFPAIGKNLLAVFLLSMVAGMPAGLLNERTKYAVMAVMAYTFVGYFLSIVFYSVPYSVFGAELAIPGLYYTQFVRFTVILIFLFVFGGIIGMVVGQFVRDSIGREETKILWSEKPDE